MDIVKVSGNDEFVLESVARVYDAKGKVRPSVTYVKGYGYKNAVVVSFEGFSKTEELRLPSKIKFSSLLRKFEDRRILVKGTIFLDGQYEKELAKE